MKANANAMNEEGLLEKYRELCAKHQRLLDRFEASALDHLVVSRISAFTMRSTVFAMALVRQGAVETTNPAFRTLAEGSGIRPWRTGGDKPVTFDSLEAAILDAVATMGVEGDRRQMRLVRPGDQRRIMVELENLGGTTLVVAYDSDGALARSEHEIRNHLTAALLYVQLLRNVGTPESARHVEALQSLVSQIVGLLGSASGPSGPADT